MTWLDCYLVGNHNPCTLFFFSHPLGTLRPQQTDCHFADLNELTQFYMHPSVFTFSNYIYTLTQKYNDLAFMMCYWSKFISYEEFLSLESVHTYVWQQKKKVNNMNSWVVPKTVYKYLWQAATMIFSTSAISNSLTEIYICMSAACNDCMLFVSYMYSIYSQVPL